MRQTAAPSPLANRPDRWGQCFFNRDASRAGLLLIVTVAAYFPALRAGFIWNDDDYVTKPALRSLFGLGRIWAVPGATEQYYPVLHSFFWVQYHLWGLNPFGYHLVGVLLHATSACLLAKSLRRLSVPGAWFAACLFALHPVCVESVAWIAEQKNTLSTVLFLGSLLAYLRFEEQRDRLSYRIALALFLIALGTKSLTATLPAALLVIRWWRVGRLEWRRDFLPLVPWLTVGGLFGLFTGWVERHILLADGQAFALNFLERTLNAAHSIWFYVGKLFWPANLIFIYPRWSVNVFGAVEVLSTAGIVALAAALWLLRTRTRAPLAVFLLFMGLLFPVLGFLNVYGQIYSYVADHWQYLPALAIIALVAAGCASCWANLGESSRALAVAAAVTIGGGLFALTYRQCQMYRDIREFYQTTIEKNPTCWMAYNNLGNEFSAANRKDEALVLYRRAVELNPSFASGFNNVGAILLDTGRPTEAASEFKRALALDPDHAQGRFNLGNAYAALGRTRDAIRQFHEALLSAPNFPAAESRLGTLFAGLGQPDEALRCYTRALQLAPADPLTLYNLGNLYLV